MGEQTDIDKRIGLLEDIEAIKKLKHRYLHCLDSKLWEELEQCLAGDVKASFMGGAMKYDGRQELMEFYRVSLPPIRLTSHTSHHPQIEITGDGSATGMWEVKTYLIETEANLSLGGMSVFNEEYVKQDGEWKIKSMHCYRLYEEMWSRNDIASLKLSQVYQFDKPGEAAE
jgi:bile-acid 7alpha-dehydratase